MERTESQKRAIESVTQPTAVIAGAGSGKTEILTGRLLHILEHTTTTLHQILAVTFTDKSALELKRRIASQLPEESRDLLPFASIGTIHSFCLNLLQEQAPLIGLHDRVNVWDEHTTHLHIHQAARQTVLAALDRKEVAVLEMVEELDFPQMLILLEDLMNARWHAERVLLRSKSGDEKEERFLQATKNLYNETRERYDRFKRERSALDFQDLEILTLQLLTQNAGVRKIVQERFTHILVDEAQDLNDLQRELLQIIFNPKTNCLCIVGDPKQSIYRFRGANVENFKILVGMIREAGGIEVSLNENFRSRPEILALINKTFEPIFSADFFTPLLPTKEPSDSPAIHVLSIPTPEETDAESLRKAESALIAARIEEMVAAGEAKYADFVLLFSSLNDIRYYEMALRHHDIPYRRFGGGGFLNAQEVCDLLFVLKILQDPADKRSLVGLMRSPLLGIPDTEIVKLCDDTGSLWEKLLERPEACWLKTLAEKKEDLRGYQILEEAILETHYDTLLEKLDPSGTKLANLEQLLDITRSLELEDERSLAEVIEHFEELKKQKRSIGLATGVDRSQDACQIMTVHASKGLEFPIVILPDLIRSLPNNSNRFLFDKEKGIAFSFKDAPFGKNNPSELMEELKAKEKEKDLEERKRLLYVALTRAEEQIIIPWHEEAKRVGPWIGWLKENIQSTLRDCASVPPVARLRRPTTLIGGSKSSSSAAEERTSFGGLPKASGERNGGDAEAIGKSTSEYFLLHPYDNPQIRTATPYYTVTELEHFEQKAPKEYPQTAKSHLKGAVFGNLIHNVLKELRNNSKLSLPKLIAIKLFEMNCAFSKEEIDETSALLEKFLKSDLAPPTWEGFHEFPFRLKIDEAVITGVIDYIYPTDTGWVICDFKTDTKADPKKYQLQMDTYALALAKGQNERPVTATKLLFLKSLLSHEEPCTTGRFETTEARLKELIDAKSATEHQEK